MIVLNIELVTQILPAECRHVYIAYSGGADSHVLLHLCASASTLRNKIIAVYINHGLQQAAGEWDRHCAEQCQLLSVQYREIAVNAKAAHGESPEAAARSARYMALQALLEQNDVLLVAQHREDQLETVLLQLFRGAGIQGLSAMPACMAFGKGLLLRPLLNTAKYDIQAYAVQHKLRWVEDPSNLSDDFDRNFLRNQVLPLLKQRWPALDKTVARTAKHCANTSDLLIKWQEPILESILNPIDHSLSLAKWLVYEDKQRHWLLRSWLHTFGLKPPSEAVLQSIIQQLIFAREDALPEVFLQGYYIKKYRQHLYCLASDYFRPETHGRLWSHEDTVIQMLNGFCLQREGANRGLDKQLWQMHTVIIRPRCGGEKLKLPGRVGQHSLKKLYQEVGVPPWERELRPLIYYDDRLAAVAGLWIAEWAWQSDGDCYSLLWQPNKV